MKEVSTQEVQPENKCGKTKKWLWIIISISAVVIIGVVILVVLLVRKKNMMMTMKKKSKILNQLQKILRKKLLNMINYAFYYKYHLLQEKKQIHFLQEQSQMKH